MLKNWALVIFSLAVCLAALEGLTRAYSSLFFPRMMEIDATLGWRHARNRTKVFTNEFGEDIFVRQNNLGLRGPDQSIGKPAGISRILVLGDSFTEAVHVGEQDTFVGRLQSTLNGYQVLNAGVGGYGTVQELEYLRQTISMLNPDIVLAAFYDNDLIDNCLPYSPGFGPRPYATLQADKLELHLELDYDAYQDFAVRVPFWRALHEYSYFYSFVNSRIYHRLFARKLSETEREDRSAASECGASEVISGLLQKMAQVAVAQQARFGLLLIPTAEDAEAGRSDTHDHLLDVCVANSIPCLSLLDALHQAMLSDNQPYFKQDIHWTSEGHRIAAREIKRLLLRL